MLDNKLSKQIYTFEKKFFSYKGEFDNIPEYLNLKIDLIIDLVKNEFYLDMTSPLNLESGIILLYGQNQFGNTYRKTKTSSEFYRWVADICDFADDKLNVNNIIDYDIMKDQKVIDLAFKFSHFMDIRLSSNNDSGPDEEAIWDDFKTYLNPKPKPTKRKPNKPSDIEAKFAFEADPGDDDDEH